MVRVVARDASKLAFAALIASAGDHLLGVPDRLGRSAWLLTIDEHAEKLMERQTRAVVDRPAAQRFDA
jgi:hypothetical protein